MRRGPHGQVGTATVANATRTPADRLIMSSDSHAWLADQAPVGLAHVDGTGACTYANARFCELLDLADPAAGPPRTDWLAAVPPDERPEDVAAWLAELSCGPDARVAIETFYGRRELLLRARDTSADGPAGYVLSAEEIAPAEGTQQEGTGLFAEVLETTTDVVAIVDHEGRPVFLNGTGRNLAGIMDPSGVSDLRIGDLYSEASRELYELEAIPATLKFGLWTGELAMRRPDGSLLPVLQEMVHRVDSDSGADLFSLIARDISDRKLLEEAMAHRATHDALTGLANRALFVDHLEQALARLQRHHDAVAVLFCDLDGFKALNDTLGHEAGDEALVTVARRLESVLRASDTPARFGGDEFAVLLEDVGSMAAAAAVAQRISESIGRPMRVTGDPAAVLGASIGVALTARSDEDPQALLRAADQAMYAAKRAGKGRVVLDSCDQEIPAAS